MISQKFIDTIKEYELLSPNDRVLVAVSGGPDSTALLFLLNEIKKEFNLKLHVAHLNHLIRKGDAELDAKYVQGLAEQLGLPITVDSFDVQTFAKNEGLGLEVAARQIRYAFLDKVANQITASKIAVGHNADDNVETFLMRLLRGAGLKGLCGIMPKRGRIIRPMLKIWRREIEDYVGHLKLVPRRDYTNYESKYLRNRVRLKLIPQLKIYNLNIKEIVLQTILSLTEDHEYLARQADEGLAEALLESHYNELTLSTPRLRNFDRTIQGYVFRHAIEWVKGDLQDLTYKHIEALLDQLGESEHWELHLPSSIYISGNRQRVTITRERPKDQKKVSFRYEFNIPGELEIAETGQRLRATILDQPEFSDDPQTGFIDHGALGKVTIVRSRQPGDRFSPLGLRRTKKLQDFLVDEKIPFELRDTIPVVESGGKILWVGGLRVDERAKVTPRTAKVVKLELL